MTRLSRTLAVVLVAAFFAVSCVSQNTTAPAEPPDTRVQDEMAIRDTSKQWAAAAQAKDPEKFVSFYADDAVLMLGGAPELSGKAAIRDSVTSMMKDPAFALSFETAGVEVAKSGDYAVERGPFTITTTEEKTKKPVTAKGNGVVVWKKQADGSWKAHVDVPVVGPPEAPAPPAAKK
jgi:uncharacterized protein (TIGR02246 family)